MKPSTTADTSGNARSPWLYAMPTNDSGPEQPDEGRGLEPGAPEALVELERGGGHDDGDEHRGGGAPERERQRAPTAASTTPVMTRVREVVAATGDATARRAIGLVLDAPYATGRRGGARARARGLERARSGGAPRRDLGREQLVVVDVGHVDQRAECAAGLVVHRRRRRSRRSRSRPSRPSRRGTAAVLPDVEKSRRRPVVVDDHRDLAGGRLGPVRERHRPARAHRAGGGAGGGGGRRRGPGRRRLELARAVGGEREPGRRSDVVGRGSRRGRGGSSGVCGPPLASTAACASSAPRMRTPSAGGDSGRIVFEFGHTILRKSTLHQARPPSAREPGRRHRTRSPRRSGSAPQIWSSSGSLCFKQLVDLGDDLVGALLELLLGPVEVVLADLAVLLEPSSSWRAWRRMLRTATRASSAWLRTTFTSSLRRSSVSSGNDEPDDLRRRSTG